MRLDSALKKVVPNISRPKKSRHFLMHCVQLPDNFQMREMLANLKIICQFHAHPVTGTRLMDIFFLIILRVFPILVFTVCF
jgi:hypothetical protein